MGDWELEQNWTGKVSKLEKIFRELAVLTRSLFHFWRVGHPGPCFFSLAYFVPCVDIFMFSRFKNSECSVPLCCKFTSPSAIVAGDLLGQVSFLDLRSLPEPSLKFSTNQQQGNVLFSSQKAPCAVTSIDVKPDQSDVVVCGMESGQVLVWDLRNTSRPLNKLEGHSNAVWDLKFHPANASLMYTASESGEVWQWSSIQLDNNLNHSSTSTSLANQSRGSNLNATNSIWQSLENEICVDSLLPENNVFGAVSISVQNDKLACAVRNQSVFLFSGISF